MTTVASIISSALRETNLIPLGVSPTTNQINEAFDRLSSIVASVRGNEMGDNLNPFPLGQADIVSPKGYPWWNNSIPGDMFIQTNTRVMCNLTANGFINLHPKPHDGARMGIVDVVGNFSSPSELETTGGILVETTDGLVLETTGDTPTPVTLTIYGNGRTIEGEPMMVYSAIDKAREWIYREDLGDWVVSSPLDLNGIMPYPPEFDDMFIIMLALRLNPRYGQIMHPASVEALKSFKTKFSARYSQSTTQVPVENGLLYLTHWNRFWGYGAYGPAYGDPNTQFNSGFPF